MQMMMIFAIIHYACTDCDSIRGKTAHSLCLEGAPLGLATDLQSVQHITSLEIILHLHANFLCSWFMLIYFCQPRLVLQLTSCILPL